MYLSSDMKQTLYELAPKTLRSLIDNSPSIALRAIECFFSLNSITASDLFECAMKATAEFLVSEKADDEELNALMDYIEQNDPEHATEVLVGSFTLVVLESAYFDPWRAQLNDLIYDNIDVVAA
ncbi:hypothetical protein DRN34_04495 [Thermococci archaeon]|nr:MAG: hypothetical protein DRN34_04495 [Thermococci archaeon]